MSPGSFPDFSQTVKIPYCLPFFQIAKIQNPPDNELSVLSRVKLLKIHIPEQ